MTTAVTLAGWLLIFGGWMALAFGVAVLVGKVMAHGKPSTFEPQGRTRVGLTTDEAWSEYLATLAARKARAEKRHADWKKAA